MTQTTKKKPVKTHLKLRSFRRVLKLIKDSEAYVKKHPEAHSLFDYMIWADGAKLRNKTPKYIVAHPCGTSCCIGGWGNLLRNADENKRRLQTNEVAAAEFYGMTFVTHVGVSVPTSFVDSYTDTVDWLDNEARYLFYGLWHRNRLEAPTKHVITKLENIIKTGKVVNPRFDAKYLKVVD